MSANIIICGPAGQGIFLLGKLLSRLLNNLGFNIFTSNNHQSRIQGGHNKVEIRFAEEPINVPTKKIDYAILFNQADFEFIKNDLTSDSLILTVFKDINFPDYKNISLELEPQKNINFLVLNRVAKILSIDLETVIQTIKQTYSKPDLEQKLEIITQDIYTPEKINFKKPKTIKNQEIFNGNELIAIACKDVGAEFLAAYPITPATSISTYSQKHGIKHIIQAEDETAAIQMALGASYAGSVSYTATSAGGFCLMIESLGYAGATQIPIVIFDVQRVGPSSGIATETAQGDLLSACFAGQGLFPRLVIALPDLTNTYEIVKQAFIASQKFQIPVIVLSDKYLATSYQAIDLNRQAEQILKITTQVSGQYQRYHYDNYPTRTIPGVANGQHYVSSWAYDQNGILSEDSQVLDKMIKRRKNLIKQIKIKSPYFYQKNSNKLIISWGSTYGAIQESINNEYSHLHLNQLWPLPKIKSILNDHQQIIIIENNANQGLKLLLKQKYNFKYSAYLKPANKIYSQDINNFLNNGN